MKIILLLVLSLSLISSFAYAVDIDEKVCKERVESYLLGVNSVPVDPSSTWLTKEHVETMLKTMTYCEVSNEIFKQSIKKLNKQNQ